MAKTDSDDITDAAADTPTVDTPAPAAAVVKTDVGATSRFAAPTHVSAITLSTGRLIEVVDGHSDVPADITFHERNQLIRAGFVPA
jgi:hypothetical protein